MNNVLIETVSTIWKKALTQGNSVQQTFWTPAVLTVGPNFPQTTLPGGATTGIVPDGVYAAAGTPPGSLTQNRLQIMPWSDGGVSQQFSLRIWGFTIHSRSDPAWLPMFLCELLCTTGAGPSGTSIVTAADPTANAFPTSGTFCDAITLTQGTLGPSGQINSTGPGSNIPAWATVEFYGAQWFFFDFQTSEPGGNIAEIPFGANAFWKY